MLRFVPWHRFADHCHRAHHRVPHTTLRCSIYVRVCLFTLLIFGSGKCFHCQLLALRMHRNPLVGAEPANAEQRMQFAATSVALAASQSPQSAQSSAMARLRAPSENGQRCRDKGKKLEHLAEHEGTQNVQAQLDDCIRTASRGERGGRLQKATNLEQASNNQIQISTE